MKFPLPPDHAARLLALALRNVNTRRWKTTPCSPSCGQGTADCFGWRIAASDRTTFRGLTQFLRRSISYRP